MMERLIEASQWLGLENGRLVTYKKLLQEHYEGQRSNEHFLAFHQAMEILSIFESWKNHADDFLGLQAKISYVFKKGTILSGDESPNSNRPRNDGFVYIMAGKLLDGHGVKLLSVDSCLNKNGGQIFKAGNEDILLSLNGILVRIECKRPMNSSTLAGNVETAYRQIIDSTNTLPFGVIAVDISKLIERPNEYLEASSLDEASKYLTDEVERVLKPFGSQYTDNRLLGLIGFASIPGVTTARSQILKADGTPYEITGMRTAVVSWVTINNPKATAGTLLQTLHKSLFSAASRIPQNAVLVT
jgi:hypothetical protein